MIYLRELEYFQERNYSMPSIDSNTQLVSTIHESTWTVQIQQARYYAPICDPVIITI